MKTSYLFCIALCSSMLTAQQFEWLKTTSINYQINPDLISYNAASDDLGNTYVCGFKENITLDTDVYGIASFTKYTSNGEIVWSRNINGKVHAYKLATDHSGNLYMAINYISNISIDQLNLNTESQNTKPLLLKFDPNGQLQWYKVIPGDFTFHFSAIAVDNENKVYIGYDDYNTSTIEQLDAAGVTLQTITQTNVKLISAIDVDSEGNIYAVGSCAETNANFNGVIRSPDFLYNTYIVKYSKTGVFRWMHYVEDVTCPSPAIKVRTPDEVYFCSDLFVPFPVGSLTPLGPENGSSDFFLTRFDASGNAMWIQEIPAAGSVALGRRNFLDLDASGNIFLIGQTRGTTTWSNTVSTQSTGFTNDIIILKYTPEGTIVWAKTATGNSEDRADSITVLPDGNLVISGLASGVTNFDSFQNVASIFTYYPFTAKLNTATLGINQIEKSEWAVYPNPCVDLITVQCKTMIGKITIYSALGQVVRSQNFEEKEGVIDLSAFCSGIYFLQIENKKALKILKN